MMSQGKVGNVKMWRRLRNPQNEQALQDEARRLDAVIAECRDLKLWIEKELKNMGEVNA